MIAEDETLEQEFLKSIIADALHPEDFLLTCESGVEAIELSKKHRPNIIIMDLMLAELDGLSAIEEIRNFLPESCIAIISAYSDFSYAQRAIRLNVHEYLLKPIKPAKIKSILNKMLETPRDCDSFDKPPAVNNDEYKHFIKDSIAYINEHFKEKLTLEMVASKIYMNPKYFSQTFKKEVRISFTEYVVKLRMEFACKLLATTNYPVYRIATECGFSDPSYFNRVFCSHMDMTPKAYRKKMNQ
ncbi:response regulator transcription factor [Alkaliphilus metalliredigens]|nr:helix-turn-helix domain-containing protein [Alkaliphilus metalliredigens]